MKYIVLSKYEGSMDEDSREFNTLDEAVKYADEEYNHLSDNDLSRCEYYYILESTNPDEDAENHYDGDVVKEYK